MRQPQILGQLITGQQLHRLLYDLLHMMIRLAQRVLWSCLGSAFKLKVDIDIEAQGPEIVGSWVQRFGQI